MMSRMSLIFCMSVLAPAFALPCVADQLPEIHGVEAQAIALAIQSFTRHPDAKDPEGGPVYGNLRHYSVQLERHRREFEVIFVPDADKYGTIGGGTAYGWEVHYHFSLKPLKPLKEDYAK